MSSATSLENDQREVIVQLSRDNLICCLLNSFAKLRIQSICDIYDRCSLLEHTKGLDQRWWQTFSGATDVKVLQRSGGWDSVNRPTYRVNCRVPLRLSSPVAVCRNLELAKGVALGTVLLVRLLCHYEGAVAKELGHNLRTIVITEDENSL